MTSTRIEKIHRELFSIPKSRVYAVLDGASIKNLLLHLDEHEPDYFCLYQGDLPHDVEEAAPYLVHLEKESPFTQWVIEKGWGNHWGIFAVARENIKAMRKHFRTLIMVKDPDGKRLFFRFYDPRIFKTFLPTCNGDELAEVFGPVTCYMQEEDEPDTLLAFRQENSEGLMIDGIGLA
ncbi:MAG: DUF4123 domain-containing protein [Desulfobacterales bacterium]|nr:DUF4123 domain-containing protein [Desulfobacterales bacterium]